MMEPHTRSDPPAKVRYLPAETSEHSPLALLPILDCKEIDS